MTETRVTESRCTCCGEKLELAQPVGKDRDAIPKPGCATICAYCGHLMMFADDLTLRNPTDAEIIELAGKKEYLFAQEVVGAMREIQKKK
jgi:hypothetical protein